MTDYLTPAMKAAIGHLGEELRGNSATALRLRIAIEAAAHAAVDAYRLGLPPGMTSAGRTHQVRVVRPDTP